MTEQEMVAVLRAAGYSVERYDRCTWPFATTGHYWCPLCGEGWGVRDERCDGIGEPQEDD
jgi:predicted RNA-binding Zn-ribbon protein involved in translation (DUF1610 family)